MNELTHISLCTGIGGFDEAAEATGFTNIANCEIDANCRAYLKKRYPNAKQYTDVVTDPPTEHASVLSFGFPCQDISIANKSKKKKGLEGGKSSIYYNCMDVVRATRPTNVIIENSTELLKPGMGMETILCDLSAAGYDAEWICLSGSQFGYPQKRTRLFIVAYPMCSGSWDTILRPPGSFGISRTWAPTEAFISLSTSRANGFRNVTAISRGDVVPFYNFWIHGFGNAVMPVMAEHIFNCIKFHHKNSQHAIFKTSQSPFNCKEL